MIDTSVLTRLRHPTVRAVVDPLTMAGRVSRVGVSDLEIGYSARNAKEWDLVVGALKVFTLIEPTRHHFRRALQVQRMLAATSQRGRKLPDLLIAAAAEQAEYAVLHYDSDYELIAKATGQQTEWVVQAGSVD